MYGDRANFQLKQPRLDKNLLHRHEELKEPAKEGPLSFVPPVHLLQEHALGSNPDIYQKSSMGDLSKEVTNTLLLTKKINLSQVQYILSENRA